MASYLVIVAVELVVLRSLSGTPLANAIRYATFFAVVGASLWVVRQRVVKPIEEMKRATQRIAAGAYHERLPRYTSIELNELATAFNQMVAALEATEQSRVELIGDVAHELRTPLASIRATMEGVLDEVLPLEPATFASVQREVGRLQRLVQQLEALSRAESGQMVPKRQSVDYARLVGEVAARLQGQYADKGVSLSVALPDALSPLAADPDFLTQILVNLLGNALQYTPTGGTVALSVRAERGTVVTQIRDTGIGIPPDEVGRIFERFYRVDKSRARSSGGNGVGLTIARHLVLAHGGTLRAESAGIGKGTTLLFTLPREP